PLYTPRELDYILDDAKPTIVLRGDTSLPDRFADWLSQPDESLEPYAPAADSLAILQYTGGSSGFPKGVNLTHRAISTNVTQRDSLLPVSRDGERVLCVMPLFHSYAMAMGLFLCGYAGATLVVQPGYHPQRLLDAIGEHAITIFPGSPTIFTGLMAHEAFARCDWRRVHTCYSGSSALPRETMERWQQATGAPIFEGYGQTEAGPVLTFNPAAGPVKVGSVGVPVAATEVQIVDVETGLRVLAVGERGEIRARGPQVMAGYHGLPKETAEALRDGWLYTGDIGELDADGYLFIRDRKKDLVIVGGYNVYPREVEEVLYAHPQVQEAAVVGQPDPYRGEVLRAFVAMRPGCAFDEGLLIEHCAANLARYKVPARIEALEALPRTGVNKIDKKPLKDRVRREGA
ncbi:MAG TPA: AMP-binding protein, partial [Ramlibacter sp.]|nr:AMP-binding protein [Ramlibacter sp.]